MSTIGFFTPVHFESPSKTFGQSLSNFIQDSTHLFGKRASIVELDGQEPKAVLLNKEYTMKQVCFQAALLFTGIIPLLLLIAKAITYANLPKYHIDEKLTATVPQDASLARIYEKKGVIGCPTKPVEVDLDKLGLNLDKPLMIPSIQGLERYSPENPTMRDLVTEILDQINQEISMNRYLDLNEDYSLEKARQIQLKTDTPWSENGSKLYFYKQVSDHGNDYANSYLIQAIKALADQGHIHGLTKDSNFEQYIVQA